MFTCLKILKSYSVHDSVFEMNLPVVQAICAIGVGTK